LAVIWVTATDPDLLTLTVIRVLNLTSSRRLSPKWFVTEMSVHRYFTP